MPPVAAHRAMLLDVSALGDLFTALQRRGYRTIAPSLRDGAIVLDDTAATGQLPSGWTDEQQPGHYRLARRRDEALFGYAVGPCSWKTFITPPDTQLWEARRTGQTFTIRRQRPRDGKMAFIGVRPCDLHALGILTRVFAMETLPSQASALQPGRRGHARAPRRHANLFIVAVACTQPAATCFCAAMGTGPELGPGFDLGLTEILEDGRHVLLTHVGSRLGRDVILEVPHWEASQADVAAAQEAVAGARRAMARELDATRVHDTLARQPQHPRWQLTASRCLSCGSCTMVCPTCFCTTLQDRTDFPGNVATRRRIWDSCFSLDFSYLHGGHVRSSPAARYRHWLTHKLSGWQDQFGTLGCVGCGRCITWCPAGIDLTEEVAALQALPRESSAHRPEVPHGRH